MAPDNSLSLWHFANALYRQDCVKSALLSLQDEQGLEVSFLLFTLWSGAFCRELAMEEMEVFHTLALDMSTHLIKPVRHCRRWLKQHYPAAGALYAQILASEVASEQRLLEELENRCLRRMPTGQGGKAQGIANAELYLRLANTPRNDEIGDKLAVIFRQFEQLPALA